MTRLLALGIVAVYATGVLAVAVTEVIGMTGGGWSVDSMLLPALEKGLSWPYDVYQAL